MPRPKLAVASTTTIKDVFVWSDPPPVIRRSRNAFITHLKRQLMEQTGKSALVRQYKNAESARAMARRLNKREGMEAWARRIIPEDPELPWGLWVAMRGEQE